MKRRYIIGLVIILIFSIFFIFNKIIITGFFIKEDYKCPNCNVILISIDALRADHLSCYGYERNTSPNLCNFFKNKTIFKNAYSSAPCTVPSVLQFLTGNFEYWDKNKISEILLEKEYNTAAIVSHHWFYKNKEYREGFNYFNVQDKDQLDNYDMTTRKAEEVSNLALSWLDKNYNQGKFFLWLHYFDPHDPYDPPEKFRVNFNENSQFLDGDRRKYKIHGRKVKINYTKEDKQHFIGLYDDEINYTDHEINRVLEKIKSLDLVKDTIIIVTSDHGEELGEEDYWDHCLRLTEEEINVPLFFSVGGKRLGKYYEEFAPVSTLDILPTILNLLNIEYDSSKFDGNNLLEDDIDKSVFSVEHGSFIIRWDKWKLYHLYIHGNSPTALYNIEKDKKENNNLIEKEIGIKERLIIYFIYGNTKERFRATSNKNIETEEELRSLGYIN